MALLAAKAPAKDWAMWEQFQNFHIEPSGRVIDWWPEIPVTTSEGQAYSLFFALVDNDRDAFDTILNWTQDNLAWGELGKKLPAWKWGVKKNEDGSEEYTILDSNNATDSDLWIAYCLLEAARIWKEPKYKKTALALLEALKPHVVEVKGIGKALLPGTYGFKDETGVTLNPSYYPSFLLRRVALEDPFWKELLDAHEKLLVKSSPKGIAPDWIYFNKAGEPNFEKNPKASYDAIRVYLWISFLEDSDPLKQRLRLHFKPMIDLVERIDEPPQIVDLITDNTEYKAPRAFNGAFLGLAGPIHREALKQALLEESMEKKFYYPNVLKLFSLGFEEGRFRFDKLGRLKIKDKPQSQMQGS